MEKIIFNIDPIPFSFDDEQTEKDKVFLRSIGLKTDCVGWCDLDLTRGDADLLLDKIEQYVKSNKLALRGFYTNKPDDENAEWYTINRTYSSSEYETSDGKILAYKAPKASVLFDAAELCIVSDKFRKAVIKHGLSGIDFFWFEDKGKYSAPQWFKILK